MSISTTSLVSYAAPAHQESGSMSPSKSNRTAKRRESSNGVSTGSSVMFPSSSPVAAPVMASVDSGPNTYAADWASAVSATTLGGSGPSSSLSSSPSSSRPTPASPPRQQQPNSHAEVKLRHMLWSPSSISEKDETDYISTGHSHPREKTSSSRWEQQKNGKDPDTGSDDSDTDTEVGSQGGRRRRVDDAGDGDGGGSTLRREKPSRPSVLRDSSGSTARENAAAASEPPLNGQGT